MECVRCGKESFIKNGFSHGRQRWCCKSCGRNRTVDYAGKYPESVKEAAVALYLQRMSMRGIGKVLGVSTQSVMVWIRKRAQRCPHPVMPTERIDIEVDEMQTYVKKRKTEFGYGRPTTAATNN
jgi:transposase